MKKKIYLKNKDDQHIGSKSCDTRMWASQLHDGIHCVVDTLHWFTGVTWWGIVNCYHIG
jgi:hypothetical protein